jgi:hypothetical protein
MRSEAASKLAENGNPLSWCRRVWVDGCFLGAGAGEA